MRNKKEILNQDKKKIIIWDKTYFSYQIIFLTLILNNSVFYWEASFSAHDLQEEESDDVWKPLQPAAPEVV